MKHKRKIILLGIISIIVILLFIFVGVNKNNLSYVVPKRSLKVLTIGLTAGAIAFSSMIFQTITNNRILTPSVLGLDSLYMFIQTFVVFIFGSKNVTVMNRNVNFIISVSVMVLFSMGLYKLLFRKEEKKYFSYC